jgi:hypothetical protein
MSAMSNRRGALQQACNAPPLPNIMRRHFLWLGVGPSFTRAKVTSAHCGLARFEIARYAHTIDRRTS